MRFIDRLLTRLRGQSGMTMIELMVAAMICSVGIAATVGLMDNSRQAAVKAEQRDVMAAQAQREVERIMEIPWANFGHGNSAPTSSPYTGTPSGGSFAYDRNNTTLTEPLVVLGNGSNGGQVASTSSTWSDNQARLGGRIYRFVTTVNANARRLTVVVTSTTGTNPPAPVLVSSIKTNPVLN